MRLRGQLILLIVMALFALWTAVALIQLSGGS